MLFVSLQCVDILHLRFFFSFYLQLVFGKFQLLGFRLCFLSSFLCCFHLNQNIEDCKFHILSYSFIRQHFVLSIPLWQTFHYYLFIELLQDPFLSSKEMEEIINYFLKTSCSSELHWKEKFPFRSVLFILFSDFKIIQVLIWNYFKKVKTIWFEFNKIL